MKAALIGAVLCLTVLGVTAVLANVRLMRVETVEVYVTAVDAEQSSIGFAESPQGPVLGAYDLRALTNWADSEGEWHMVGPNVVDGSPECIPPGSAGAKVRLTLTRALMGSDEVINRVATLQCLEPPTFLPPG